MRGLVEERDAKLGKCLAYREDLLEKIALIQQSVAELDRRVGDLGNNYGVALQVASWG